MLETEFNYYKNHQEELVGKYLGKFLVIVGEKVEGVYESEIEAYTEAEGKFGLGRFLLRQCLPGEENYTQTFNLHVVV